MQGALLHGRNHHIIWGALAFLQPPKKSGEK
jgi:hypothetical protein